MISFKGARFPKDIILYAVFFYVRYAVSYRNLKKLWGKGQLYGNMLSQIFEQPGGTGSPFH
ncbi:hypothetical protein SAMN05421754_10146 [Nitrosomonas sp. Nm58]|jgi:hypothetical protein|nr:hypothetical protein [Nitrosomonas sp. Nm58]SDY58598.1 hypothetical protein SAMN05421754_10146 [Nitrosomonas sp. Nm58]